MGSPWCRGGRWGSRASHKRSRVQALAPRPLGGDQVWKPLGALCDASDKRWPCREARGGGRGEAWRRGCEKRAACLFSPNSHGRSCVSLL